MGRHRRPSLPGAIFHATARTLHRERLFTPDVRTGALADLVDVVPASASRILGVAIMSNHLHVVLQQGPKPLEALMQPLLRRIAHRAQRAHGREGPIFWRHYSAVACLDPWHARNTIVYTHLNPVRAGICDRPGDYPWTSHLLYDVAGPLPSEGASHRALGSVVDPLLGLPLFATGPGRSAAELRDDYRAVVDWRLQMDRLGADPDPRADDSELPAGPAAGWAGSSWAASLSPLFHPPAYVARGADPTLGSPAPDMTTIARNTLAIEAPGVPLERVRRPGRGHGRSRLRHAIMRRLHAAGYRNIQIARFMQASESTVSNAVRQWKRDGPKTGNGGHGRMGPGGRPGGS
ncbi:MAG: hypothetical protein R3314_13185 [Longimicrobiales bacterium]|nr:hypothetical protein [Longimicrobiales bacterium]